MIAWLFAWLTPASAAADWLLTPYVGLKFAGDTNFVDLEKAAGETSLMFGGSAGLLGEGALGVEVDFGYSPRFFQRADRGGLVLRSNVTTLTGNLIVAAPLRWTRQSLRPYLVGGLGLMHAGIDDVLGVFRVNSNLLGLDVGGGVIGFVSDRTGVRLEIRHFKNLNQQGDEGVGFGATRLSFWRASAGVVLRY